jgi:hypothetical protein
MEILRDKEGNVTLKEVFNPLKLETESGDTLLVTMRDSGFEFKYGDKWFRATSGTVREMKTSFRGNILVDHGDVTEADLAANVNSI